MLSKCLRKQLSRSSLAPQTGGKWGSYNLVKQERAIHKESEADDLEPFECLPSKSERYDPDEERAAGIYGAARSGGDSAGNRQAEEVEATEIG